MRIAIIVATVIAGITFTPSTAIAAGYGDGLPAPKKAQKAACKGLKGATKTSCVKLAKLPDWWLHKDGVNVHRPNGVNIIKAVKGKNPVSEYRGLFDHNIKLYADNHARIQA